MGRSVLEVRQNLEASQYKMVVWEKVVDFLSACVDTETREAKSGIAFGKSLTVPQELISEIIQDIEAEKIDPLRGEVKVLENLQVVETKDDNKQGERQAAGSQQKVQKRVRVLAKPG